jgi:3'-phosphoadenosine 5'-phosphosulfate (PAPS) 3'-phosphatase
MSLASQDAAAGALLVTETGGHVCDFDGSTRFAEHQSSDRGRAKGGE